MTGWCVGWCSSVKIAIPYLGIALIVIAAIVLFQHFRER
jgi:hypothetical protein